MVSNLSANNRGSEETDKILNAAAEKAQELKFELSNGIDADTNAFNEYIEARRLPSKTEEEKLIKFVAEQGGLKKAVHVPLKTARLSFEAIKIAQAVVDHGNPNSITDVGVGAQMAYTGVKGGIYNVLINLKDIKDEQFIAEMKQNCATLEKDAFAELNKILSKVEKSIS